MLIIFVVIFPLNISAVENPKLDVTLTNTYFNIEEITIPVQSSPSATLSVYVNGQLQNQFMPSDIGDDGILEFKLKLDKDKRHKIKIIAEENGISEEKEFEVTIDTINPVFNLEPIKNTLIEKSITIKGFVNEDVTVNFYIDKGRIDEQKPNKVTGIRFEDTVGNREEYVSFIWNKNKETDIDKYVIFREDTGMIAILPSTQTKFTDSQIDSNTDYVYSVSALDSSGNLGDKEQIKVKTLDGDKVNTPKPRILQLVKDTKLPIHSIKAKGGFESTIRLQEDGDYNIKIEFIDLAGNMAEYKKSFILDTKPPKIEDISPRNGILIFEHSADRVKFQGTTEPNIEVKLHIDKSAIEKETYKTKSDSKGNFVFDRVNLLRYFNVG
ncbi:MAG: hypothetical protein AABY14_00175, partial [Nanoarchaeota archaeon]